MPKSNEGFPQPASARLQVWGGVECSIVRINDGVRDQVRETGHYERHSDLDLLAQLGIQTVRYPVLWEAIAPDAPDRQDWAWHDKRLNRLRALGIRPILGLMHHGSGPHYANFHDGGFALGLARMAEAVARRYPWADMFTPVNEPLTTARFSGMYGHWYPHTCSEQDCLRILVEECLGVVLAMQAIRKVTPHAQLLQTEDLGRVFSTSRMQAQADYENTRRWLSLDLVSGLVDREHPMFRALLDAGVDADELALIQRTARPIDIIGINHYLTSDRYLDERLDLFPPQSHGGNGRERYADVEAFRTDLSDAELGPGPRLREAWRRYQRPLIISEVHNGSTEDEQARWLMECWNAASQLRSEGADVRAITPWALFGMVDWRSLLVRRDGHHEYGAFVFNGKQVRPTLLASAIGALCEQGAWNHPLLQTPGWWRHSSRSYTPQIAAE
ncbi:family 1 glycosylhydrolase [uncultured Devosia sp.]|uniref:family 1 glycosylhydrolase n=1 Tax=uncultured Devosia sp. TaxID=211434 RepID=UPI0035CBC4A6